MLNKIIILLVWLNILRETLSQQTSYNGEFIIFFFFPKTYLVNKNIKKHKP